MVQKITEWSIEAADGSEVGTQLGVSGEELR